MFKYAEVQDSWQLAEMVFQLDEAGDEMGHIIGQYMKWLKVNYPDAHLATKSFFDDNSYKSHADMTEAEIQKVIVARSKQFTMILLKVLTTKILQQKKCSSAENYCLNAEEVLSYAITIAIELRVPLKGIYLNMLVDKVLQHSSLKRYFSDQFREVVAACFAHCRALDDPMTTMYQSKLFMVSLCMGKILSFSKQDPAFARQVLDAANMVSKTELEQITHLYEEELKSAGALKSPEAWERYI